MTVKEISEKRWFYTLYDVDGKYVITVPFCESFVDFSRAFEVELNSLDEEVLTTLSKDIINNYEAYRDREVPMPDL